MTESKEISSIAIIGAGIAGVSCALALGRAIPTVKIFEKSYAAGGRMRSRSREDLDFDCGAQYFTARTSVFRQQVTQWREQWLAEEWRGWLVDLHNGEALSREDDVERFVGRPFMHSCVEDMASLCEVSYRQSVARIERQGEGWRLFDEAGNALGDFDAVVMAIPAPQAVPLLQDIAPVLAAQAAGVDMTPCWAVMLAFGESLQLGFDGAFLVTSKLSWAARNSSKPERGAMETWVLHGSPEWTEAHLDMDAFDVMEILLRDMEVACERKFPMPEYADAKLWRYALPVNALGTELGGVNCLYDASLRIGACGDWCCAPRIEGAYLSGMSMAAAVLQGNAGND
jgi:hypothetical protein